MLSHEYDTMRGVEDGHWWYRGLHGLVGSDLQKALQDNAQPWVLDAGCGTGGLMARLKEREGAKGWRLHGVDLFDEAVAHTLARGFEEGTVGKARVEELPFGDANFDAVTSLDVLYHEGVDNERALREFMRVMKPGGTLVLNLPAFASLSGRHDVAVSGARRYTASELRGLLEAAGFEVRVLQYWNAWLFLPVWAWRRWSGSRVAKEDEKEKEGTRSDLSLLPGWMNRVLTAVTRCDMAVCRFLNWPFGISVYAVACKPGP